MKCGEKVNGQLPNVASKASFLGGVSLDSHSGSTTHLGPPSEQNDSRDSPARQGGDGTDVKLLDGANSELVTSATKNINMDALKESNIFYKKQKRGNIDVWWLFDDGGKLWTCRSVVTTFCKCLTIKIGEINIPW